VLEEEQHGRGGGALREQRKRLLEDAELRSGRLPKTADRAQRLDERLVRELRADEIDRAADEHLEAAVASAPGRRRREPRLADPRVAPDEHRGASSGLDGVEQTLELPELPFAPHEHGRPA